MKLKLDQRGDGCGGAGGVVISGSGVPSRGSRVTVTGRSPGARVLGTAVGVTIRGRKVTSKVGAAAVRWCKEARRSVACQSCKEEHEVVATWDITDITPPALAANSGMHTVKYTVYPLEMANCLSYTLKAANSFAPTLVERERG